MMPKPCVKYRLTEEDIPYYHSGIDGSLFMAADEQFFKNEEYCIDFFLSSDPSMVPMEGVSHSSQRNIFF
jgi:hypothetical protein